MIKYGSKKFFKYNNSSIAHIGVGIMILGITCSSVFQNENRYSITKNQIVKLNNYSLMLKKTEISEKKNFQELIATFLLYKNNTVLSEIKPSKRYYHVSKVLTTEAGIYHHWFQDFYIVLGNNNDNNWNIRVYQNPLVNFIWLGGIIMILSGIIGIRK